jgi:hypothetical protein
VADGPDAQQGATLHTAPGPWPGIVGALLAALGGVLVLRRGAARGASAGRRGDRPPDYAPRSSFALAAGMFFVYALLLVGRGRRSDRHRALRHDVRVPVPVPAAQGWRQATRPCRGTRCGLTAIVVTLLFEHLFYVRLP